VIRFNITASGTFTDTQIVADTVDMDGPITMTIAGKDISGVGGGAKAAMMVE
jgi:hypothetical protein